MSVQAPPRPAPPQPPPAAAVPPASGSTGVPARVLLAAALASAAAAWMLGGVFEGPLARILALAAVAVGVGWTPLAARLPAGGYLVAPLAFVVGFLAALVLPNATGVRGTIPTLVVRAIRSGGLLEPPVPFDPGWRFLVVTLFVIVGAASATLALGWDRPHLALALPVPLVIGGGFVQPRGSELLAGSLSLVLLVASLMAVYAAQLAGEAGVFRGFELRQAARGAAVLGGVAVALAALNRANLLFPKAERARTLEAQKPRIVPLSQVKDRVLFTVRSTLDGPWRLGVLDTYDGQAWLLPPFDVNRFRDVPPGGRVASRTGAVVEATFTIRGLEGHTLPSLANPVRIAARGRPAFDPRTQTFRQRRSGVGEGYTYTVTAAAPPSGPQLAAASGAIPEAIRAFAQAPPPPPAVNALLAVAPANPWERLQFLRNALYEKVVAAGSGVPVDVPPRRVEAMLRGGEATPFEIVAAEALLARWAGLPARIGYGFFRGAPREGGWEVHPRDGANWLEAFFPGHGWVPVIGVPPRARASLSAQQKRTLAIRPAEELSIQLYIPTRIESPILLYQVVRYWIGVALPFVTGGLLLWTFLPAPLRLVRAARRRRWAAARGPRERIAVEYAEFRDLAADLGVGNAHDTPLEFLDRLVPDDEHEEFAWLVTRCLWGDLTRDIREEDVEAAVEMGRSLRRRLARGQSPLARVLALASRTSLREPYDPALPNAWPRRRIRGRVALATAALLVVAACGGGGRPLWPPSFPQRVVPPEVAGLEARLEREASKEFEAARRQNTLVHDGALYTLRREGAVEAALEVVVLKPQYRLDDLQVLRGVRASIERGRYRWFKVEGVWVGEQRLAELNLYWWWPKRGNWYAILLARPQLGIPKDVLRAIIGYQRGAGS